MHKITGLVPAVFLSFFLIITMPIILASAQSDWHELKGTHFLIYSQKGTDAAFAQAVLSQAEQSYSRTIRYFGALPKKDFWLWDNRCKIYIYESQQAYLESSKQPEWSGGFSIPARRTIVSYHGAPQFLESILPHEMAHLIFREFVGFRSGQIPRWLDEGFAVWQEEGGYRQRYDQVVFRAVENGAAIPIRKLNQMNFLHEQESRDAELFYAQSQSIVRFLLEGRDPSYFINFCRALRDGADFEEALRKNYKRAFSNLDELEARWKDYVLQKIYIK